MKRSKRAGYGYRVGQRGASLLEAIAFLGVAAIVLIGAIALFNGAFSSASTNAIIEQVSAIQTGVRKLYMGQPGGYADLNNTVLANARVFPSTLVPNGDQAAVTNTWNGPVTVTGNGNNFTIEYDNVPSDVCVSAVTASGNWIAISVNSKSESALPLSPSTASADCSGGTSNTIIWTST